MTDERTRPFLIQCQPDGSFRLTVRDVRYNSQGYPVVTATLQDEVFATSVAAKNFARVNFDAKAGMYSTR